MTTPRTPESLAELLAKMTPGKWEIVPYADLTYRDNVVIYAGGRALTTTMTHDAPAIAALANLATGLQELWAACEQAKKDFMAINDGFFTGLVPPEFGPVAEALNRLAKGDAHE